MEQFVGGSGIAIAFVVLLWVGLLVPGWVRERNARQAQRHAIRLQQTIRALAETSDRPEIVDLEANARVVRAQRRELKRAERAELVAERERSRLEAEQRERAARAATERAEQELREASLREETWRLAAELRTQQLNDERAQAEAAMADAEARRQAAARARAAAADAAAREALASLAAGSAHERWANGNSGAERAVQRRITGELPVRMHERTREAAARRRRGRLASSVVALIGLISLVSGAFFIVGGAPFAGLVPTVLGLALVGGAVWMLQRIHRVALAVMAEPPVEIVHATAEVSPISMPNEFVVVDLEPTVTAEPGPAADSWTPVPVPAPLYLQRATADELEPPDGPNGGGAPDEEFERDLAALLREEAKKSAEALREAHRAAEGAGFGRPRAQQIAPITVNAGEWERMGDAEAIAAEARVESEYTDLDAVLRRRRAG